MRSSHYFRQTLQNLREVMAVVFKTSCVLSSMQLWCQSALHTSMAWNSSLDWNRKYNFIPVLALMQIHQLGTRGKIYWLETLDQYQTRPSTLEWISCVITLLRFHIIWRQKLIASGWMSIWVWSNVKDLLLVLFQKWKHSLVLTFNKINGIHTNLMVFALI